MRGVLPQGSTIGIIGGGQLGRMLAMAASRFSYHTIVLDPQENCPAAQCCSTQIAAPYDDETALKSLAERADIITYEFENVPVAPLKALGTTPLAPGARALEMAQDRLIEKDFLNEIGIKTAPYRDTPDLTALQHALETFGGKGILKTRRLGYDGKGQVRLNNPSPQALEEGFAALKGADAILEGFVPFEREISVIASRNAEGQHVAYPPARNIHRDGILATSTVPCGLSDDLMAQAKEAAIRLLEALDYVGTIGVEFFVTQEGELLANEFAPRVHNSGHWTEAATAISQFEMHIRAITGHPLPVPILHSACEMHNLIGDEVHQIGAISEDANVHIHLYGKAEARSARKMGHYTRIFPQNS